MDKEKESAFGDFKLNESNKLRHRMRYSTLYDFPLSTLQRNLSGNNIYDLSISVRKMMMKSFYSRPQDQFLIENDGVLNIPFAVSFSNNYSFFCVADELGYVYLIDSTKKDIPINNSLKLKCHDNAIFDISWSYDDKLLASSSGDQTARVLDVSTQKFVAILSGCASSTLKQVSFQKNDPNILATCSRNGKILIWDLRSCSFKPSSESIQTPVVSISNAHGKIKHHSRRSKLSPISNSVTSIQWLHRKNLLASACDANSLISIWDIRFCSQKFIKLYESKPAISIRSKRDYGITSLAMPSSGSTFYGLSKDNYIYAYSSILPEEPIGSFTHPQLVVKSFFVKISCSRDGEFVGCGSTNSKVIIADTASMTQNKNVGIALVAGCEKEITGISWSYDDCLASISDDASCRIWRQSQNNEAKTIKNWNEGKRWRWGWSE
ncbi:uncharacterized protein T551_02031 [Pneumocystis jirovecii RU7]|uniref:Uncharacterized protein n=1 Tax=Pneumocystis jirovecii (strain RU7) TaxID=1408657 RepID=A0A0W4ZNX8_PNEJ7|nr:uncharacterized protein T551_02031 [Pneumocystis jirovecii RU7]KTW30087.1 hypothetical protein T551_02031 [Pneumocystis jirovecii RU7]